MIEVKVLILIVNPRKMPVNCPVNCNKVLAPCVFNGLWKWSGMIPNCSHGRRGGDPKEPSGGAGIGAGYCGSASD
jgi:hypothetical protein